MPSQASIIDKKLPTVVLVGRVNVGKSTLFNKLVEEEKALVSTIPGTTRTNNEGLILWRGKNIKIIDTGGLTFTDDVPLEKEIITQSEYAIKKADLILFITDGKTGILPQEYELAKKLKNKQNKTIMLVANKIDKNFEENQIFGEEWFKLGFGAPFAISAINGRNVGDLLDLIYKTLSKLKVNPKIAKTEDGDAINISLIGKPNVGKSSLFNKLIGEEKVIVSPMPHTTREPHDTEIVYEYEVGKKLIKQKINFIDTAGIRRKSRVSGELEKTGIQKSINAIAKSDIILFVIDGNEVISGQDQQLGGLMERRAKSVIILVNKWDLNTDNSDKKRNEVKKMVYTYFPHLDFAPMLFVSGLNGYRVHQIYPLIMQIWQARHTEIPEETLNKFLHYVTKKHLPSRGKGVRNPEILGLKQIGINPPVFDMLIKQKTSLHRSYVEYIENKLREQFDFAGTPIIIKLSKLKR